MSHAFDFTAIPHLTLSRGAHPSPKEGLCFYEAVAFFAGEPHGGRPECVDRALVLYGSGLNDNFDNETRNKLLLPLIPQVAGTRGTLADQRNRATFLTLWNTNKILPKLLRMNGLYGCADACEQADTLEAAESAAESAAKLAAEWAATSAGLAAEWAGLAATSAGLAAEWAAESAGLAAKSAGLAATSAGLAATSAAKSAGLAAKSAAKLAAEWGAEWGTEINILAAEGLRQAILIGPHEGFSSSIDLEERSTALRTLVSG